MNNKLIVAYKFGKRFNGDLSPKEGINVYELHAREHGGKVLFTINKSPSPENRDRIEKIILTTQDGSFAVIADVDFIGKGNIIFPPSEYTRPSIWDNEDIKDMAWFAISNLRRISINKGDYECVTGKDLLDSISGNGYMAYINL